VRYRVAYPGGATDMTMAAGTATLIQPDGTEGDIS